MLYSHEISPDFKDSMLEIEFYLFVNEGVSRCDKVINSIYEKIQQIISNPLHFTIIKESNLRKAVHFGTYIIVFRITKFHIEFIDIYHGKRNI